VETKTRKRNLPGIFIEEHAAQLRGPVILSMNAETVEVFATPVESQLKNFMELSDAGIAGDQQSPPDQRTDVAEYDSKLVKFGHMSRLPNLALTFSNYSPRNLPLS